MGDDDYDFDDEYGGFEKALQRPDEQYEDELDEYRVFERAEYAGKNVEQIASDAGIVFTHKKGELIKDPVHRFYIYVNASAQKLIREGYISFVPASDIPLILTGIKDVKNIKYKNADAFVLGYAVSKSGSINAKHFNDVVAKTRKLEPPIKPADIIRYARLWISLKR
jgi:Family of unknown function (DUF5770)